MYMYVVLRNAARRVLVPQFFKKKWPCVLLTCALRLPSLFFLFFCVSVDLETTCKTFASVSASGTAGSAVVFEATFPNGATGTAVPGTSSQEGVLLNWSVRVQI